MIDWAHSVEAFDGDGQLAGGLYGVRVDGLFAGESMFHSKRDASKVALMALVDLMRTSGMPLLDVQWCTDHLRLARRGRHCAPRVPREAGGRPHECSGRRSRSLNGRWPRRSSLPAVSH